MAKDKLVDAAVELVRAALDHPIEPEHLERIRKGIDDKLDQGARLRRLPLANDEEPVTVFQPYRDEN